MRDCSPNVRVEPLDRRVRAQVDELAARGLRCSRSPGRRSRHPIARARTRHVEGGLDLLGLLGMIDPPRPEAIAAIAAVPRAGIAVKMITGDHVATARGDRRAARPREAGGRSRSAAASSRGSQDAALAEPRERHDVFARVAPEHKLRLVEALQSRGQVVAMTGDGVNDAPGAQAGRHRRGDGHDRHRRCRRKRPTWC